MEIALIAAVGRNNELGIGKNLIWHFHEDMLFFKNLTMSNTVIMGRKTFETLPHALPNRENIVITRNSSYAAEGAKVVHSAEDALKICTSSTAFIIGGAEIYSLFIPFADTLYLTEIDAEEKKADVFFPEFNKSLYTKTVLCCVTENDIKFSHVKYQKI